MDELKKYNIKAVFKHTVLTKWFTFHVQAYTWVRKQQWIILRNSTTKICSITHVHFQATFTKHFKKGVSNKTFVEWFAVTVLSCRNSTTSTPWQAGNSQWSLTPPDITTIRCWCEKCQSKNYRWYLDTCTDLDESQVLSQSLWSLQGLITNTEQPEQCSSSSSSSSSTRDEWYKDRDWQ